MPTPTPSPEPPVAETVQRPDDDHGDDLASATSIVADTFNRGEIDQGGDTDFFSFTASEQSSFIIEVLADSIADSRLHLYDQAGEELVSDAGAGRNRGSRISWTAPAAGTYYLKISPVEPGVTGSYGVIVSAVQAPADRSDEKQIRGQVLEVVARNAIAVQTLIIRDETGREWTFTAEEFLGVTPDHLLQEHRLLRLPVTVFYVEKNGTLIARRVVD
ncbi:MAG: PPC domain-containing protein [Dehalococcoidia bacterium]